MKILDRQKLFFTKDVKSFMECGGWFNDEGDFSQATTLFLPSFLAE